MNEITPLFQSHIERLLARGYTPDQLARNLEWTGLPELEDELDDRPDPEEAYRMRLELMQMAYDRWRAKQSGTANDRGT